jgi:hypothetical protein
MATTASKKGVSDRDERQRRKLGTRHSINLYPTACLFGQSPPPFTDRLPGSHGLSASQSTATSPVQAGRPLFAIVFWLLAEPDCCRHRFPAVAGREKATDKKPRCDR